MGDITFQHPPLVEVSFGLHFHSPPELRTAHYGLFWASILADFPDASDQPLLVDFQSALTQSMWFGSRVWLVHKDKSLLLQIQHDRMYVNWRRLQPDIEYPRFTNLAPIFRKYSGFWAEFVDRSELGTLAVTKAELSYINHLPSGQSWKEIADIGKILTPLEAARPVSGLPSADALSWRQIFRFPQSQMSVDLKTLQNAINVSERMFQLEIKAESTGNVESTEKALEWMIQANVDIVTTFCSVTSEWAQKELWGRGSN